MLYHTGPVKAFWCPNTPHRDSWMSLGIHACKISRNCCTHEALPESVGFEGGIGVDVVMQPPLHRHVPVTHAMSDLHTEVSVVAVDVLDGFEVIFLFGGGIRAGHKRGKQAGMNTNFQQQIN